MPNLALQKIVDRLESFVALVGNLTAWLVLGLVLLIAFNVLARYMFSAGTVALQELEWHVLAVTALVGMSYGINRGDEVRVDMLYANYSAKTKAAVDFLAAVLMLLVALFIIKVSIGYVAQSYAYQEGSPDPGGLPYRYLLKALIPVGFLLLSLQAVVEMAKAMRAYRAASAASEKPPRA